MAKVKVDQKKDFLIFDRKLKRLSPDIAKFIESFPFSMGVASGEALKDLDSMSTALKKMMKLWQAPIGRHSKVIVLGGGSVGDFGGFLASILKRGVGLIHIPSTWLATLDSAHGGKTALNVGGIKNQIGSFYPAQKIFIIRELLDSNSRDLEHQAYGELIKMGLIGSRSLFEKILKSKKKDGDFLWSFAPSIIKEKYKIVHRDPFESTKIRECLNFGHSFGHVLEAEKGWSHGESVMQGIYFALNWSVQRRMFKKQEALILEENLFKKFGFQKVVLDPKWRPLSKQKAFRILVADKKMKSDGTLSFVFLKGIGQWTLIDITPKDLLSEAERQGWVR